MLLLGCSQEQITEIAEEISKKNIELQICHIQIDEHSTDDKDTLGNSITLTEKAKKALKKLRTYGCQINIVCTKGIMFGISKFGLCCFGDDFLSQLCDELIAEIGKWQKQDKVSNVARDALIAVSSLDNNYFLTSDLRLKQAWDSVISKHQEEVEKKYLIPKIIRCTKPTGVYKSILFPETK